MKKLNLLLLFIFAGTSVFAQGKNTVDMADALRSNGKIYVVVTVIAIIFLGLALFLFSIDRRLKNLEKGNQVKK